MCLNDVTQRHLTGIAQLGLPFGQTGLRVTKRGTRSFVCKAWVALECKS